MTEENVKENVVPPVGAVKEEVKVEDAVVKKEEPKPEVKKENVPPKPPMPQPRMRQIILETNGKDVHILKNEISVLELREICNQLLFMTK